MGDKLVTSSLTFHEEDGKRTIQWHIVGKTKHFDITVPVEYTPDSENDNGIVCLYQFLLPLGGREIMMSSPTQGVMDYAAPLYNLKNWDDCMKIQSGELVFAPMGDISMGTCQDGACKVDVKNELTFQDELIRSSTMTFHETPDEKWMEWTLHGEKNEFSLTIPVVYNPLVYIQAEYKSIYIFFDCVDKFKFNQFNYGEFTSLNYAVEMSSPQKGRMHKPLFWFFIEDWEICMIKASPSTIKVDPPKGLVSISKCQTGGCSIQSSHLLFQDDVIVSSKITFHEVELEKLIQWHLTGQKKEYDITIFILKSKKTPSSEWITCSPGHHVEYDFSEDSYDFVRMISPTKGRLSFFLNLYNLQNWKDCIQITGTSIPINP